MSLFGSCSKSVDIMHIELKYIGFDDEPVSVEGWIDRHTYVGSMLVVEWYNPDDPDFRDRDEVGCARVVKLDRHTNWIEIEKGAEPPDISEVRRPE